MSQTKEFRREVEKGIRDTLLASADWLAVIPAEQVWTGADTTVTSHPSLQVLQAGRGLNSPDTGPGKAGPMYRFNILATSRAVADQAAGLIRKLLTIPTVRAAPIETTNFRVTEFREIDAVEAELPIRQSSNGEPLFSFWLLFSGRVVQRTQDA